MKLNEVLINKRTVKYDKSSSVGSRWLVVDESTNRVIETHATKPNAFSSVALPVHPLYETASPSRAPGHFIAGELFELGGSRWGVGLDSADEVIEFVGDNNRRSDQALAAARNFLNNLPEDDRTNAAKLRRAAARTQGATIRDISRLTQSLARRAAQASATSFEALGEIRRVGPTLRAALQNPYIRGFGRIAGATGLAANLIFSGMEIINDLENEAEDDPNVLEENMELRNIVVGQISVQVMFLLLQVMRNASLFNRALRWIKWTVRSAQGAAALTGVGTIPSVLSVLITEAGWLVAGWVITSPSVQRSLAEWMHGNIMGVFVGGLGAGVVMASSALDAAFDGQFGTGAFRRALGWERRDAEEAPEGEYSSSSEWAKLVFHGLLFPPGREQMLVPYIAPEQRAALLRQKLDLAEETPEPAQPVDPAQPAPTEPTPTSEPGLPVNPDAPPVPQ
jgi:hypothetical protein